MTPLARCVMVQGTASDVGKSVVATALCRVLAEEGYRVAPFKGQNMSLNAAVTPDGGEIGRAQAAQAEAAGVIPHVDMNPILLKPESDTRSQVVVLGRARRTVAARDYWRARPSLWPTVTAALGRLRRAYDVVVIEGAGSPAEVNLARGDLANMRVARAADARVLLVGDIERGGVFAQLVGTLDLLPSADRRRVRGLLVNKFRGEPALFDAGRRSLARRAGVPVLGVLPYDQALGVPAEDSLGLRDYAGEGPDIAVVRLPHLSNFDEFDPLAAAGARLRFVDDPRALGVPDALVLPGTKTTIADLAWLRTSGLAARIRALADAGVPILGVCGGFQMLGEELADPGGADGSAARVRGLGLLPVRTTFARRKRTIRVRGTMRAWGADGLTFGGYEIHTGRTRRRGVRPLARLARADGTRADDGAVSDDGLVVGTYVHGVFETAAPRDAFLGMLARRGGGAASATSATDRYAPVAAWLRAAVPLRPLLAALELDR